MPRKKTQTEFIQEARKVHGDKYDYSFVEYRDAMSKVLILCKVHGVFAQAPNNHVRQGQGCRKCGTENSIKKQRYSTEYFIKEATEKHMGRYDYTETVYVNSLTKIKIICKVHGDFEQFPSIHLKGANCLQCSGYAQKTTKEFIVEAQALHGDKYLYSEAEYINSKAHLNVICKMHGAFSVTPNQHLRGAGCPKCNFSRGELRIEALLTKEGLMFEVQKTFTNCRSKKLLPFDFYISSHKLLIEYDGEQHYREKKHWGGVKALKAIQRRDTIKTAFAEKHGYKLLRIPYTDYDRIEEILTQHLAGSQLQLSLAS